MSSKAVNSSSLYLGPVSPGDPFKTGGILPTEAMPDPVQKVVNRDYRALMQAIDKKKGKK